MVKSKKVVNVKKVESLNKIPVGVQIISVLYYISAVLSVIFGLLLIIGANALVSFLVSSAPELASIITGGVLIGIGIIFIGIGVLGFFVGRGLWKLKAWARIFAIIFAILGVAAAIYSMIKNFGVGDIIKVVVHGVIGCYLILNKEAIGAFK
ncbi:MAG: hypothetical protein AABY32_06715 [Nanoarchaeota archaeon]